uniref:Uncharacterized protein n=1 Tax=Clytia hemisphaerica TaxID=252671 RepID=A0A7M5XEX3_9CNID
MPSIAHYSHDRHDKKSDKHKSSDGVGENSSKRYQSRRVSIQPKAVKKRINIDLTNNKPKSFKAPLYHLQGRHGRHYVNCTLETPVETKQCMFRMALEIMNRRSVRKLKKPGCPFTDTVSEYFYVCIGEVSVALKGCIMCRDQGKERNGMDFYFMDLVEISKDRTILCVGCFSNLVSFHVPMDYLSMKNELLDLREKQPEGVYVDPFLITCGY